MNRPFYFLHRALRNIREEWLLNLRVVTGFSLMVVVIGLFLLVGSNLRALVHRWGEQLQITAYLKKGIDEQEGRRIARMIAAQPEVEGADFVSESLALSRFRKDLAGLSGVLEGLEENPLPASIEIRVPPELRASTEVVRVARQIGTLPGVEEVEYGQQWVERYGVILQGLSLLGTALSLVLLFVGWGSISNLIQLTVYARKSEIEVLKLVGATDSFVRTPFLIEGILQGTAASLLGTAILYGVFQGSLERLGSEVGDVLGVGGISFLSGSQMALLVGGSVVLAFLASFVATGRHLRV
ncbi:MAG: ABC transporter permease [Bdellovibrionota bacterium]